MSAAVASADLKTAGGSSSSPAGLVMNPLVSSLSRHASLHSLHQEPALKKRKISETGIATTSPTVTTTQELELHRASKPTPTTVSGNNSSCDSTPPSRQGSSRSNLSAAAAGDDTTPTEIQNEKDKNDSPKGGNAVAISQAINSNSKAAAVSPPATATSNNNAATTTTATAEQPTVLKTNHAEESASNAKPAPVPGEQQPPPASVPPEKPPLKSTKMSHLRQKYTGELEYMLREFEKLERQLLGARKTEESAASRERREKLHSFILHLTETIQQIEKGCQLEAAGKSTLAATQSSASSTGQDDNNNNNNTDTTTTALANPSQDKEEEENIQKLEEHILANLLPVKVRLKKQLAAQQGAKHNPATMPHRGGHGVAAPAAGTTFADSARRQQEAAAARVKQEIIAAPAVPVAVDETQFGKPLVKGSSLTKKLHGPTLGSSERAHGDGVGVPETNAAVDKKKYIGGLAVGSEQLESSFDAASNVHKLIIQEPDLVLQSQRIKKEPPVAQPIENQSQVRQPSAKDNTISVVNYANGAANASTMSEERRRKLRRKKRKKMRLREQAKAAAAEKRELEKGRKQKTAKKSHRGPRHVEYMCALCNEVYNSTCDYNPWWALAQHDCPKCRKRQVSFI